MLTNKIGYSYNDLTIVPSVISDVASRSECNPFVKDNFLPIFASPMASVVSEDNIDKFLENGIIPIIPRNINIERRKYQMKEQQWVALSLKEFEEIFVNKAYELGTDFNEHYFIVVDIANGHMKSLYEKCIIAKENALKYGYKITIMTGNIANPETYKWIYENALYRIKDSNGYTYFDCAIDYIRVGIGGGSGCITTSNVSAHYPQATLINECKKIKDSLIINKYIRSKPAIVADGGIRNYDHVIKALALGADYVMIGSVFAQCIESAGEKTNEEINHKSQLRLPIERYKDFSIDINGNWLAYYTDEFIKNSVDPWRIKYEKYETVGCKDYDPNYKNSSDWKLAKLEYQDKINTLKVQKFIGVINVKFFGMASADGQKAIDGKKKKTAEGITKYLPVKYTLAGWVENMISYLRSAMSYTDCKTLKEFIGKPELIINSISEIQAVNK